jgi:hypothetical protein
VLGEIKSLRSRRRIVFPHIFEAENDFPRCPNDDLIKSHRSMVYCAPSKPSLALLFVELIYLFVDFPQSCFLHPAPGSFMMWNVFFPPIQSNAKQSRYRVFVYLHAWFMPSKRWKSPKSPTLALKTSSALIACGSALLVESEMLFGFCVVCLATSASTMAQKSPILRSCFARLVGVTGIESPQTRLQFAIQIHDSGLAWLILLIIIGGSSRMCLWPKREFSSCTGCCHVMRCY